METYCVKFRRNTKNLNSKIFKTKSDRLIMQSKCPDCGIKTSRFMKEQETKYLLGNLGIKALSSKIPLFHFVLRCIIMNEIVNKFLLAGDKFIPELHFKQPGFTYSACGRFTRNKEKIKKFMQTENKDFIQRNELNKAGKAKDSEKRANHTKF